MIADIPHRMRETSCKQKRENQKKEPSVSTTPI